MRSSSNEDFPGSTSPITREVSPSLVPSQLDHRQAFYNFSRSSPAPITNSSSPRPREMQNSPPIDAVTTVVKTCKHCTFPFRVTQDLISVNQEYCSKECRVCHQWFMKPSLSLDHVPLRQPSALAGTKFVATPRQASSHAIVPNVSTRPAPFSRQISLPENLTDLPVTVTGNLLTMLTKPTQVPTFPSVTSTPSNAVITTSSTTTTTTANNVISVPSTTVPIISVEKTISLIQETHGSDTTTAIAVPEDVANLLPRKQLSPKQQQLLQEQEETNQVKETKQVKEVNQVIQGNQVNGADKQLSTTISLNKPNSGNNDASPTKMTNSNKIKLAFDKLTTSSISCSNELLRSIPPSLVPSSLSQGSVLNQASVLTQEGPTFTPTPPHAHDLRTNSGGVGASVGRSNHTPKTSPKTSPPKEDSPKESSSGVSEGESNRPKSSFECKSDEFSDEISDPMGLGGDRTKTWRDRFSDHDSCSIHTSGGIFTLKEPNMEPVLSTSNKPFLGIDRVDTEKDNSSLRIISDKTGLTKVLLEAGPNQSPRVRVNLKEIATAATEWLFTPKQPKSRQRPQLHLYY